MAIGIELARVIGPLTPFPRKVLNAKSAITVDSGLRALCVQF